MTKLHKTATALLLTAALLVTGCSGKTPEPDTSADDFSNVSGGGLSESYESSGSTETSSDSDSVHEPVPEEPVNIASIPVKTVDWEDIFDDPIKGSFQITDKLGENYYGTKSTFNGYEIENKDVLLGDKTGKELSLKFPENFPEWCVGSGAFVTLNNRYFYNWLSYTSQFSPESLHDMKLTRVDGNTGVVTVVDEVEATSPFIYLVKIDENSFLSYSVTQAPSDVTGYATLTTASIYYSDGTKKEIISEKYENEADWADSIGTLIENFAVKDGEIYGFGRRRISGEYKFFLYHYNSEGDLLETTELPGMESIMGSRQASELYLVGDHILFRTYEDLTRHICKITDSGVVQAAEDIDYAVSGSKIFFIESNVDDSGNIKDKEIPLYSIDTATGEIIAVNFEVPEKKPYFIRLMSLSNGDLAFQYCPDGEYDQLNFISYVLPINEVNAVIGAGQ